MTTYTIANFAFDYDLETTGQSFTPNDLGPDGSGTPGTTTVRMLSYTIGYPNYGGGSRCEQCYVYDTPLSNPSDAGSVLTGLVARTSSYTDETDTLGPGSFARKFTIDSEDCAPLAVDATYYIYFSESQIVRVSSDTSSGGGSVTNNEGGSESDSSLQFQIELGY